MSNGFLQEFGELTEHGVHLGTGPEPDDHERYLGVAAEEPGASTLPVRGAVHSEEHGGPREAALVQQIAHRTVGRNSTDPVMAADVDGQLADVGDRRRRRLAADQLGPFQG